MGTSSIVYADNWRASIRSAVQIDNRYSPSSQVSADGLLTYAYDDVEADLHGRLNFLVRGGEYFYQRGEALYELSIEKGLDDYDSRIKAGRLERSDNLGFYFLDGLELTYKKPIDEFGQYWGLDLYAGKPGRIDDGRSIEGDYLWGAELFSHQKMNWQAEIMPLMIDVMDVRFGLQQLKNKARVNRFNLGINSEGKLNQKHFKGQLLLTYQYESRQLEDLLVDLRVPVTKALRLRFSYEYYRPDLIENPGFREQFFGYYALGQQKLMRSNMDYQVTPQVSMFIEGIHSRREMGDSGTGVHTGIKIRQPLGANVDMDLSLAVDNIELGEDRLSSIYLSVEQHINSRLNLQLDAIIRREDKFSIGENRVFGLNGKLNYMLKNNLIFSLQAKAINNSRLRNEHLVRLSMTYYFDNFKVKRGAKSFSGKINHAET